MPLDKHSDWTSSNYMKAGLLVTAILALALTRGVAQSQALGTSRPADNSKSATSQSKISTLLKEPPAVATSEVTVGKNLKVSGPVVHVSKARRVLEVPRRIGHLINPFAPTEHVEEVQRTPRLSSRAWSTTVGWHPGGSSFPDATTHEPSMTLLTVGR